MKNIRRVTSALVILAAVAAGAPQGAAQVPAFKDLDFQASATGTVLHADALQNNATRLVDTEVAFTGASVDPGGLAPRRLNEMQREIHPALSASPVHARGSGLEVGLAVTPDTENQLILAGSVEAQLSNPQPAASVVGPVDIEPVAYADLLRGEARTSALGDSCVLGEDLSRGLAHVTDVQVLDTGGNTAPQGFDAPVAALDAPDPERAVSRSLSRTVLVAQKAKDGRKIGDNFGLMSEVRQTIAPVTLLKNSPSEFTIEFLGEWVLQAVAGGVPGGAFIHYGPGTATPETPVLRLIDAEGDVTNVVTLQQVLGQTGLAIEIPGVAELAIGEDPRAIGGDATTSPTAAGDGTVASAAVDVVRVKLLEQVNASGDVTLRAADLRVGHMEVATRVPAGGIACSIPVRKTATPPNVVVGQQFDVAIRVDNPFDCDIVNLKLEDVITTIGEARFAVRSTTPGADASPSGSNLSGGTIVWNNLGTLAPKASTTVTVRLEAQGGGGEIRDVATASGALANCRGQDAKVAGVGIGAAGSTIRGISLELRVPVVAVLPLTGPPVASTVAVGALLAVAATGASLVVRRKPR